MKIRLSVSSKILFCRMILAVAALTSFAVSARDARAGVIMQAFYWDAPSYWDNSWWKAIGDHSEELAASGFTAIWIPPAMKSAAGGYSVGYDPYDDYDLGKKDQRGTIGTRWGRKHELLKAVAQIHSSGLQVYGDFVLAHRNGDDGQKNFRYKNALGEDSGGRFEKSAADFTDQNSIFGRSLNHYSGRVQWELQRSGAWQVETLGLDGIRIDYAKGIPGWFLRDYFNSPVLNNQLGIVEYWDENVGAVYNFLHGELNGRVKAFDFPLWGQLKDMSNGSGYFDMRKLVFAGLVGRDPYSAVTFVENHDTDQNFKTFKNKQLGYAYILTSEGYPSVFWKDYYVYGMKWLIDKLVWVHENLAAGSTVYRWADDDLLVYERQGGGKLLVGLNDSESFWREGYVQTNFGPRVKLKDYTGQHDDLTTDDHGGVKISIRPVSYAAYAPEAPVTPFQPKQNSVTQIFAGADDLDIPAANGETFIPVETVSISAKQSASWRVEVPEGCDLAGSVEVRVMNANEPRAKPISTAKLSVPSLCARESLGGEVRVKSDGDYRFEIRIKKAGGGKSDFKLAVTYLAPRASEK